ncbi:conserved hypothetical protein [Culex quinquefasciatus]|uniref:Uncharacterized protein n=1 Tax=Culex quinquefasciatus TaxID=7176 RepID=B0WCG7_CULQU|nr:conserved hypothetical protein [Culex quinquefasciatus]|eukprot:XP_001846401.1 conserved hypothetical protein [Culex quinquefasciatus]
MKFLLRIIGLLLMLLAFDAASFNMETKEPQFAKVKPAQRASWLRKYPELASGPYAVLIRQQDTPINLINLADTINRYYLSIKEISKQNRHTVKVLLTDRVEANHLTQNPTFTSTYRVYVPCRNVEIDGIVDEQGLNSTDLLKHGVGKFKKTIVDSVHIIRCSQLAKYSSEQNKYLPAQGLRVTFAGTILPDFIEYKHVLIPVRLFIPKPQLNNLIKKQQHPRNNPKKINHTRVTSIIINKTVLPRSNHSSLFLSWCRCFVMRLELKTIGEKLST